MEISRQGIAVLIDMYSRRPPRGLYAIRDDSICKCGEGHGYMTVNCQPKLMDELETAAYPKEDRVFHEDI